MNKMNKEANKGYKRHLLDSIHYCIWGKQVHFHILNILGVCRPRIILLSYIIFTINRRIQRIASITLQAMRIITF